MICITRFPMGTFQNLEKSVLTFAENVGEKINAEVSAYCIKTEKAVVLIDPYIASPHYGTARRREKIETALSMVGLCSKDVDYVIHTHLHRHCFADPTKFPNAKHLVQEAELEYALSPISFHIPDYKDIPLQKISFSVIKGDCRILPGITLIHLPGHTPGFQSVLCEGKTERFLFAGSFCPLSDSVKKSFIPPGIHTDLEECFCSYEKIQRLNARIIFGFNDMQWEAFQWQTIR